MNRFAQSSPNRTCEAGSALIEFAICLPILAVLTLGSLELIHLTNVVKVAAQISREAANVAFRECTGLTNPAYVEKCLEQQRDQVQSFVRASIRDDVEVILSLYRTSDVAPTALSTRARSTSGKYVTRYSESGAGFSPHVLDLPGQSIYVGEVFIPYDTIITRILDVFSFGVTEVYDSTVL